MLLIFTDFHWEMTSLLTLPFCNTPLQTPWQSSTCGLRRYRGWLISKLIPQSPDDTEVLTLKRAKIEPRMDGSPHITVRGLHRCDCLGSLRCRDAPRQFILAGKPDWKLQVLSSLAESCDFQHGLDRGTGNMSEIDGGLGERWMLARAATPTTAEEIPPHSHPTPVWKQMCRSGSSSTQCGIITHVSIWVVIGLLWWKWMCGTWLILF